MDPKHAFNLAMAEDRLRIAISAHGRDNHGGEMEDGTIYGRATEATDPLKTCGNCHWHRKLNFDEKDLLNPVQPIPTICGVNPPTVHLIPRTVDYLAGKQTALFPENLWPFPPANEPGCSKWEAK